MLPQKAVSSSQRDLDIKLSLLFLVYHKTYGLLSIGLLVECSPTEILYGRELSLSSDLFLDPSRLECSPVVYGAEVQFMRRLLEI